MSIVTVIRHSKANYPFDELTEEGIQNASLSKERFSGNSKVVCSPLTRSRQTAIALGFKDLLIDDRLHEFEVDISASTAEDYIARVHTEYAVDLYQAGDMLLNAIKELGEEDCLFIAHNAIMSAAFFILTGQIFPFENLQGFQVNINDNKIIDIKKL